MNKKPIYSARSKGLDIAIWEGSTGPQYTIRKNYKCKQTETWKESKIFFSSDLEILKELITEALSWGKKIENIEEPAHLTKAGETFTDLDDDDIPF